MNSDGVMEHDPGRVSNLANMRRPDTMGESMKFLQDLNWMRTSLPPMTEVIQQLRFSLEQHVDGNARRIKRVAISRAIPADA